VEKKRLDVNVTTKEGVKIWQGRTLKRGWSERRAQEGEAFETLFESKRR